MLLLYIEQVISNDETVFTVLTNFQAPRYCLKTFDISDPSKVIYVQIILLYAFYPIG